LNRKSSYILAEVTPEFLAKYKLKANGAILADDSHKDLFKDMTEQFTVDFVPGGATRNTVRMVNRCTECDIIYRLYSRG